MPAAENGWLIERGDSEVSRPLYWMGTATGDNATAWTFDPNNCVRFAREQDAAVVAHNLMGRGDTRIQCRIKEHGWG